MIWRSFFICHCFSCVVARIWKEGMNTKTIKLLVKLHRFATDRFLALMRRLGLRRRLKSGTGVGTAFGNLHVKVILLCFLHAKIVSESSNSSLLRWTLRGYFGY